MNNELWNTKIKNTINFLSIKNKRPYTDTELGCWLTTQNKDYNNNTMDDSCRYDWERIIRMFPQHLLYLGTEDTWRETLLRTEKHFEKYNERGWLPLKDSLWICVQEADYVRKANFMESPVLRAEWESMAIKHPHLFVIDSSFRFRGNKMVNSFCVE